VLTAVSPSDGDDRPEDRTAARQDIYFSPAGGHDRLFHSAIMGLRNGLEVVVDSYTG
jgi:hypothetical protein